ncbi:Scd6-like Sm domain-containing protein [Tricladium varicosporioides]|nr:Scd6-like Sm domain-containing protein [Hymenoscyphus varicosporioides]
MTEFLGARISLVSRSDIRYVGTLHEINSESSTVALENVSSFGTEGRKGNPDEEIPPSDSVYEYIVFRGSDVKDLRIEEAPAPKENKPPQVPNDPAILGSGSRPTPQSQGPPGQNQQQRGPPGPQQQGPPPGVPPFAQHPQHGPPFYAPPSAGWGRGGPPGPGGFYGMPPYGGPPGWYPPPGQGFPQPPPGAFPPYGYPPGPPGQFQQQNQPPKPAPIGPGANKQQTPPAAQTSDKPADPKTAAKPAEMAAAAVQKAPTPPKATKPSPTEVQAAVAQPSSSQNLENAPTAKPAPSGPKNNNRIQPAIPLQSPAAVKAPLNQRSGNAPAITQDGPSTSLKDATEAATAAVAAAMAKLPPAGQTNGNSVDNLTRKVNEMRVNDPVRAPRNPTGAGGFPSRGTRGGRGGARNTAQKVDVPAADFDFEESNAKFNKQDLVKEAIAGSPLTEDTPEVQPEAEVPLAGYNKSTSFFDNISSESKDRAESGGSRPGGREWRGEEQKKNVETFGQGSVDNGYRGGFRGRGRGRGYRGRGYNNQSGRGRGGYRGGRGDAQTIVQ